MFLPASKKDICGMNFVVEIPEWPLFGSRIIGREQYYRVLQPQAKNRYSSDDAVILSMKNRHHGPWG
jgi:hypothetical protein